MNAVAAGDSGGGALLRQSLRAMKQNLHTVHAQSIGFAGPPTSGTPKPMTITGDCRVRSGQAVARFRITGWRVVQSGPSTATLEKIDERFVTVVQMGKPAKVWERSARTHRQWRRADSNDDASAGGLLCPSGDTFLFGCLNHACTRLGVQVAPNLQDLGTRTIRGQPTIYLHSLTVTRDHDTSGKPVTSTTVQDFYLARDTHFLVRLVQTGTVVAAGKTTFRQSTTVDYSRYNSAVSIGIPPAMNGME
jgi:hypothetical protein